MMRIFLIVSLLNAIVALSAVGRVWRASALDGLLMCVVPFYAFFAMAKYWNDPASDIRYHMLLLLIGGGAVAWSYTAALQEARQATQQQLALLDEARRQQTQRGEQVDAAVAAAESDDPADGGAYANVEISSKSVAGRALAREQAQERARAGQAVAPAAPVDAALRKPLAAAPSSERPPDFRSLAATAMFEHGRYERDTAGFGLNVPAHFRFLSGHWAGRLDAALGLPKDPQLVGWGVHENVGLADAATWHVTLRWLDDGQVRPDPAALDPVRLLQSAQSGAATSQRLLTSGGELLGFAVAPELADGVLAWVEERLPAGAAATVLDCHALRPGPLGTLELSIVGSAPGTQGWCLDSVRLFARRVDFRPAPPAGAGRRAAYTLAGLLTRTQ